MTLSTWDAAVDLVVSSHLELGMTLARARVEVREYPAGTVLIVRVHDDVAQALRYGREDYEPCIIAACAAVGITIAAVAFVEAETSR